MKHRKEVEALLDVEVNRLHKENTELKLGIKVLQALVGEVPDENPDNPWLNEPEAMSIKLSGYLCEIPSALARPLFKLVHKYVKAVGTYELDDDSAEVLETISATFESVIELGCLSCGQVSWVEACPSCNSGKWKLLPKADVE